MSPWMRRLAVWSLSAATATGIIYFVMKYLLTGGDEFSAIHHPLQPSMLKLHLAAAPFLVFALGVLVAAHVGRHLGKGTRYGRRSGLIAITLGIVMILSGYGIQLLTGETTSFWTGMIHTGAGVLFTAFFIVHRMVTRAVRRRLAVAGVLLLPGTAHATPAGVEAERAWPVMGTTFVVALRVADAKAAEPALEAAREAVFRVDSLMSTYRPASELSRLNASAGTGASLVLSPETAAVLATALDVGRESGGAFDVTVGPLVGLWDFFRDRIGDDVEPPTHAAIDSTLALVGQEKLRYDPASRRVSLPLRGMMLDFGAIAKGYALDCAAGAARRAGASSGLMDLGGQVLCFGDPPDGERWRIGVRHPRDPDVMAGVVEIESGSLSTSGDYHRFTTWKGRRYSSHFDPRSGWPVQGLAAVTVLAPSGIEADAWSTALFVLGAERGRTAIEARDDLGALWFLDPGARPLDVGDTRITGTLAGRVNLSLP